ncbi:MAG TPA: VanW family protein [Candidatus Saccharimonadales bacterium]|nr:VanW family protein [Candidatus Saccharimonadales bacterium]
MINTFKKILILVPFALAIGSAQTQAFSSTLNGMSSVQEQSEGQLIAEHTMSLADRYPVPSVNTVFRDNILLTLSYMSGSVKNASQVNWDTVRKPTTYEFTLQPGEVFAFHDDVLPEFVGKKIITTNAHFSASEGFEYDGDLYGDGVCHFATLINWVARDAGLEVVAPTRHDFAKIPDIDPKYGTAIYDAPGETAANEAQNLYVENTFNKPVKFVFRYANDALTVSVYK